MSRPLALGLYSLRHEAERDFAEVLKRVAAIGYVGVEAAGLHGMAPEEFRRRIDDVALELTSCFVVELPVGAKAEAILDEQQRLGNDVVVGGLRPKDFVSQDAIARGAEQCNEACDRVRSRGMTLGYHNHWWEFADAPDGRGTAMEALLERLDPDIFLETDIYWLQTAGVDPEAMLSKLGSRVHRLHVKDGPCTQDDPQVAVGRGAVDVPRLLAAVPSAEWHIAELDHCAGDMFEAVEASYRYLTENGLSVGRDGEGAGDRDDRRHRPSR
jgi:sugar phosphate isomerase/epimerase